MQFGVSALLLVGILVSFGQATAEPRTAARARGGILATETHYPMPTDAQRQQWIREFFVGDEIWLFADRKSFDEILDSSRLDPALRRDLAELFTTRLSQAERTGLTTTLRFSPDALDPQGAVRLPEKVRAQIPRQLLEKVYRHQAKVLGISHQFNPPLWAVQPELRAAGVTALGEMEILKNAVQVADTLTLPLTRHTWSLLPEAYRSKAVETLLRHNSEREGLRATLTVRQGDDLGRIAATYAGERDPRPIERYLRQRLGQAKKVEVPLERILHPFIRRMLNTYSSCDGPSCFNTGPNVNRSAVKEAQPRVRAPVEIGVTRDDELLAEAYSRYRFVKPGEPLRAGDLMVYRNPEGLVEHVATYIPDPTGRREFVFVKNGQHRVSPYILQELWKNEAAYPDAVQLSVYRVPGPGESVISPKGVLEGPEVVYRRAGSLDRKERSTTEATTKKRAPAAPGGKQVAKSCTSRNLARRLQ